MTGAGVRPSARARIAPFRAMAVLAEANRREAEGREVFHLEVGEPDAPTPAPVREAARRLLAEGRTGYTEALGLPSLREAIAGHYRDFYGAEVPPERIAVTSGASGAFVLAFLALFEAGDRVALAVPGYPAYRNILEALGVEVVPVAGDPAGGGRMTVESLAPHADGLAGVVLASPANPTGSVVRRADLEELAAFARARGIRVVADEIYHGIVYGEGLPTAVSIDPDIVVVNSFSKYFAMTGWRLGWMVVPPGLRDAVERLAMSFFLCAPSVAQAAAGEVFGCYGELDANVARYRANRDLLLRELPRAGFGPFAPADGAFYLYAGIAELGGDSSALAGAMLRETGVAATPGIDFDPEGGAGFIRFSYAGAPETIAGAAERLLAWRQVRA